MLAAMALILGAVLWIQLASRPGQAAGRAGAGTDPPPAADERPADA